MSLGAGYNAKLRSLRYVVMVDDTATSWNAFQVMNCFPKYNSHKLIVLLIH